MAVLFLDNFTDTDAVGLDDHTPDQVVSGAWTEDAGTWAISGNAAAPTGGSPGGLGWLATFETSQTEHDITVVLSALTTSNIGILLRYVDATNFVLVGVKTSASQQVQVVPYVDGASAGTINYTAAAVISSATVRVVLRGNVLSVCLNGAWVIETVVTQHAAATKCGLRGGSTSHRIDSFQVSSAPGSISVYVREDGTCGGLHGATSAEFAATALSIATLNATYPAADDTVYLSNRGGDITTQIVPNSSGTDGHPVVYCSESGYVPNLEAGVLVDDCDYVELQDLKVDAAITSSFKFSGTSTGVVTRRCVAANASNECFQHIETASVTHYDLMASDPTEECISAHDTAVVTIYGATLIGGGDACVEYVGAPTITIEDGRFFPAADKFSWKWNGLITGGLFTLRRCICHERGVAARGPDLSESSGHAFQAEHCVFIGCGAGDYYLYLPNEAGCTYALYNCLFYRGANTSAVIYAAADVGLTVKNCCFAFTGEAANAANGTWDYNCFYEAGTARGDHTQTGNPKIGTGFCLRPGSSCIGMGTDLSGVLSDIKSLIGKDRTSWDIGASVKKHKRNAALLRNEK